MMDLRAEERDGLMPEMPQHPLVLALATSSLITLESLRIPNCLKSWAD